MKLIAIDFDHTVHNPSDRDPGYKMGKPLDGSLEVITRWFERGDEIIYFTERGSEETRQHVIDWLNYFHFPGIKVTNKKEPGWDVIVDNKAPPYFRKEHLTREDWLEIERLVNGNF